MERRKQNRYRLGVAVIFSWRDARQAQHDGIGLTRDIRIAAAFFATAPSPPPFKANIKLKVFLPPARRLAPPMKTYGEGQVVRVEAIKDHEVPGGFAVGGKPFVLRRGEEYR
jgi:hypothetical protein